MTGNIHSAIRRLWQTLSSIKTGVVLLIITVIVSAAGTVILQRPATDADEMQRAYSPQVLHLLDGLGLTDVFHAWWFVLLLVLVSLSIVCASIQRFPNAWRFYARPHKCTDETFRKGLQTKAEIPITNEEAGLLAAERAFRDAGTKPERVVGEHAFSLFAERNRFSEMAVYIVHASLLLIFLGGIVDALYGWSGFVALVEKEQSNRLELKGGKVRQLPFTIRCDAAGQENYADGTPKRWWSKLTVLEDGREVKKKEIVVNDPLVYRGVRFYQSSYGNTGKVDRIVFAVSPTHGKGDIREIALGMDQTVSLDADASVHIAEFIPDYVIRDGQIYTRSDEPGNPAVHLVVESAKSASSVNVWLPAIPGFENNASSPYQFEPRSLQMVHFTGLQVSHEPGQWAVWSGVIVMGFGLVMVFYVVHTRLWAVPILNDRGRLVLWVGGTANRNRDVFEQRFKKLVRAIESQIEVQPESHASTRETSMAGH